MFFKKKLEKLFFYSKKSFFGKKQTFVEKKQTSNYSKLFENRDQCCF